MVIGEKTTLEEMGRHYSREIRKLQPRGPYLLGGASFGGALAYDIAQQLVAAGHEVGLVFLLDTGSPETLPKVDIEDAEVLEYLLRLAANIPDSREDLRQLLPDEQIRYFLERGKKANKLFPAVSLADAQQILKQSRTNLRAMGDYKPQPYPGRLALFQAKAVDPLADAAPGKILHEMRGVRGDDIAMVFQEPMTALNPLMTIGQQIAEVLELKRALTTVQSAQAAVELLANTGIPEPERRANSFPHQLSGGQRQRAMIAMALASEPALLLADEPTTALDVTLRGQILDLLSELQRSSGMAVLLITHDLNLVRRFADRVAVMEQGVLVEQGSVADVFRAPQHPYTQRLIASQPRRDVCEDALPEGTAPVVQAQNLRVVYPTPLPGIRGWFRKGEFVAVQGARLQLPPGRTLGGPAVDEVPQIRRAVGIRSLPVLKPVRLQPIAP